MKQYNMYFLLTFGVLKVVQILDLNFGQWARYEFVFYQGDSTMLLI